MLTKKKVLATLKDLPEKFSAEDLIERIILLQKIEIGLEQSKKGQVISDEELGKRIKKWFD